MRCRRRVGAAGAGRGDPSIRLLVRFSQCSARRSGVPSPAPAGPRELPLPWVVALSMLFFVFVPGRFGPAGALVTGSVRPSLRVSFMTFNASIQQLASGIASLAGGLVIGRAPDGTFSHFGIVGWLAVGCALACVWPAGRIRMVEDGAVG